MRTLQRLWGVGAGDVVFAEGDFSDVVAKAAVVLITPTDDAGEEFGHSFSVLFHGVLFYGCDGLATPSSCPTTQLRSWGGCLPPPGRGSFPFLSPVSPLRGISERRQGLGPLPLIFVPARQHALLLSHYGLFTPNS